MLTEGKSIVEYIGDKPDALNVHFQGALRDVMTFEPNPAYGNRRVEVFRNHEVAQKFLHWQNREGSTLFKIADDLILAGDRAVVAGIVKEILGEELRTILRRLEKVERFMEKRGA